MSNNENLNCKDCDHYQVIDKMIFGFYEIRCSHPEMRDHRVLKILTEDEFQILNNLLSPKYCPLMRNK